MSTTLNTHQRFGVALAMISFGKTRKDHNHAVGAARVMQSADAGPYQRELCKLAAAVFEADGMASSPEACLFRDLAQTKDWHPAYNRFTDSVCRAVYKAAQARGVEMHKAAFPTAALTLHEKTGVPGMLKTLVGTGLLSGSAVGALAFILNRDSRQSSEEAAALLEKTRAYNQMRRDIEEDMAANGTMNLPSAKADPKMREKYEL